jgi:uncharacterized protein (DUF488 family)
MTPESLAWVLSKRGVRRLVDVRLRPFSRKRGFSKAGLSQYLGEHGIEYIHMGELGNPPEIRKLYQDGRVAEGKEALTAVLRNGGGQAVDRLVDLAADAPTAVMCLEADAYLCHRSVITSVAEERSEAPLEIVNL